VVETIVNKSGIRTGLVGLMSNPLDSFDNIVIAGHEQYHAIVLLYNLKTADFTSHLAT